MTFKEFVHKHFPDARPSGKGFKAKCPVHDDRTPSLSLNQGGDGRALMFCHAGCSNTSIAAAIGISMQELFLDHQQPSVAVSPQQPQKVFSTAEDAVKAYGRGEPDRQWAYRDANGKEVGRTLRWNVPAAKEMPAKKKIRPISVRGNGWSKSFPPTPRLLFNLPALVADSTAMIYVAEGEKAVDALAKLGFLGTTSMGGGNSSKCSDWSALAGRSVVILPDNDETGREYADEVTRILHGLGATVRIVELPGLPKGGDVADLLEQCATDEQRKQLREQIEYHTLLTEEYSMSSTAAPNKLAFIPFPTEALPVDVRRAVTEAAHSIGCDESQVALHALSALGVACGNWRVEIKEGWTAPPAIWSVIAMESGQQKSPALDVTLDFFRARQEQHDQNHRQQEQPKNKPSRPFVLWADDGTTAALDDAFKDNSRAILYACDELSNWLGTFGRFMTGASSSDEGWYCQRYGGRASNIIRKSAEHRGGCAKGVLGITGCCTTATLRSLLTQSVRDCGLMARLLICIPPVRRRRWTEQGISAEVRHAYYDLLHRLLADSKPSLARFSESAKALYVHFFDQHNEEAESIESGELRAAWGKLEELPARLALLLQVAEGLEGDIPQETMAKALLITEWAKHETRRVYGVLLETAEQNALRAEEESLLAWMAPRGWVSERDVQRGPARFRGAGKASTVLNRLLAQGFIVREDRQADSDGGHPSTVYRLHKPESSASDSSPTATEPQESQLKQGCVAVTTAGGGRAWTKL